MKVHSKFFIVIIVLLQVLHVLKLKLIMEPPCTSDVEEPVPRPPPERQENNELMSDQCKEVASLLHWKLKDTTGEGKFWGGVTSGVASIYHVSDRTIKQILDSHACRFPIFKCLCMLYLNVQKCRWSHEEVEP